jgi:hypothetical protein
MESQSQYRHWQKYLLLGNTFCSVLAQHHTTSNSQRICRLPALERVTWTWVETRRIALAKVREFQSHFLTFSMKVGIHSDETILYGCVDSACWVVLWHAMSGPVEIKVAEKHREMQFFMLQFGWKSDIFVSIRVSSQRDNKGQRGSEHSDLLSHALLLCCVYVCACVRISWMSGGEWTASLFLASA